jgi:glutamine synthetase type III
MPGPLFDSFQDFDHAAVIVLGMPAAQAEENDARWWPETVMEDQIAKIAIQGEQQAVSFPRGGQHASIGSAEHCFGDRQHVVPAFTQGVDDGAGEIFVGKQIHASCPHAAKSAWR